MKSLEKEADLDEFDIFPHISDCTVNTVAGKNIIMRVLWKSRYYIIGVTRYSF